MSLTLDGLRMANVLVLNLFQICAAVLASCNVVVGKYPSKHETLNQCWVNVGPASQTVPNIYPALIQRILLLGPLRSREFLL